MAEIDWEQLERRLLLLSRNEFLVVCTRSVLRDLPLGILFENKSLAERMTALRLSLIISVKCYLRIADSSEESRKKLKTSLGAVNYRNPVIVAARSLNSSFDVETSKEAVEFDAVSVEQVRLAGGILNLIRSELGTDINILQSRAKELVELTIAPLHLAGIDEYFETYWEKAKTRIEEDWGPAASFWIDWYEQLVYGRVQNWLLIEQVALINSDVWEEGVQAVHARILEIQAEILEEATRGGEELALNEEGRLTIKPLLFDDAELYRVALEKVRDAMEDLRHGGLGNSLLAASDVMRKLDRAFQRYTNSPQRIHDEFEKAKNELNRLISLNEINGENGDLVALVDNLDDAAIDIRGSVPNVAKSYSNRLSVRLRELTEENKAHFKDSTDKLADISDEDLARDFREDSEIVLEASSDIGDGRPTDEQRDAAYRLGHRVPRAIRILRDRGAASGKAIDVTRKTYSTTVAANQFMIWALARMFGL